MPICRFAAEPPQGALPPEETLQAEFLAACLRVETEEGDPDLGAAGEIHWFPDRTWSGRTYVPATARTDTGLELFGYVSFAPGDEAERALRLGRLHAPTSPRTIPSGGWTSPRRSSAAGAASAARWRR